MTPYELGVALLPIGAKDLAEDEEVELIGVAVDFDFELFQQDRGEGAFAGEEEGPVFFGEQVMGCEYDPSEKLG